MPTDNTEKTVSAIIQPGSPGFINTAHVPTTYANGTIINLSAVDIQIVLVINSRPITSVSMPLATAKALQKSLLIAINDYERKTGMTIGDTKELSDLLGKS